MSHCPHCNRVTFEIEEVDIAGAKQRFVQCSGCKSPVGVLESEIIAKQIRDLEQRITEVLRVVVASLQKMNSSLDRIEEM
jgi:hypothetical protein